MKNVYPLRAARRKAQRLAKLLANLGDHPLCLFCGCTEPMLLRSITRGFFAKHRRFFEEHHVFGRMLDSTTTLALCFNCHALITEGFLQAGVTMAREPDPCKLARNVFRTLAVHHRMLSNACWRFAGFLSEEAEENSITVVQYRVTTDIVAIILQMAWPVWKVHRGRVPDAALRQLEKDRDWPCGCAGAAMRRISGDARLRYQLEKSW
jgi:hypothetical protein